MKFVCDDAINVCLLLVQVWTTAGQRQSLLELFIDDNNTRGTLRVGGEF